MVRTEMDSAEESRRGRVTIALLEVSHGGGWSLDEGMAEWVQPCDELAVQWWWCAVRVRAHWFPAH